jgi:F0F1-type ATP synthase beta subunit
MLGHSERQSSIVTWETRTKAFANLEIAYAARDTQMTELGIYPEFDPLRSDPRFTDLERRVGILHR